MGVIIEFQSTISVEEFCRLREAVGFQKLTIKQGKKLVLPHLLVFGRF